MTIRGENELIGSLLHADEEIDPDLDPPEKFEFLLRGCKTANEQAMQSLKNSFANKDNFSLLMEAQKLSDTADQWEVRLDSFVKSHPEYKDKIDIELPDIDKDKHSK